MEKKILVVDDSRFIFEEMKFKMKASEEYKIAYYCSDGEGLLDAYEKYRPDLVTVDIVMPGIDGIEASKRLLEKHPEARVIIVTSMVFDDTMEEAEQIGALGFLAKPFETSDMINIFDLAFKKQPLENPV